MGITDPKLNKQRFVQDINEEVLAFRTKLRAADYLSSPSVQKPHASLSGVLLDPDLQYFCQNARMKRAQYVDSYLVYEVTAKIHKRGPPSFKELPVFVTKEEREKFMAVENLITIQIKHLTEQTMQSLADPDTRDALESTWADISQNNNKGMFLDFYYEVQELVNNQNPTADTLQADDEDEEP